MSEAQIRLTAIRVSSNIGVPDEERIHPQSLEIDLVLVPQGKLEALNDEIERTIDYHSVWQAVREIAGERPRKLIETLAEEVADRILTAFPLSRGGNYGEKVHPSGHWIGQCHPDS